MNLLNSTDESLGSKKNVGVTLRNRSWASRQKNNKCSTPNTTNVVTPKTIHHHPHQWRRGALTGRRGASPPTSPSCRSLLGRTHQPIALRKALPVKFVVYPRADDILSQRDCSGSANRQRHCASDLAEIDEEIFGFGCPIVSEGELNSRADSPATHHVADCDGRLRKRYLKVRERQPPVAKTRIRSNA